MNPVLLISLLAGCVVMIILERLGAPTTLQLSFRGDIKRESQWLAQYGQFVCTAVAAALIWQFDVAHRNYILPLILGVSAASISAFIVKRIAGRMRPNRPNAGRFMGFTLKHDNARESFPSSHSACAVALTVMLTHLYPQASEVFWSLAICTAVLRYLLDAHWPSDVLGGIALGYAVASGVIAGFKI